MVTPVLPSDSANMTGSPAHVLKTVAALEAAGSVVEVLQIDISSRSATSHLRSALLKASKQIREFSPDVIHCHGHIALGYSRIASLLCQKPTICELHGVYVHSTSEQLGARPLLSAAVASVEFPVLSSADAILCQSYEMLKRLKASRFLRRKRMAVIYPGVRCSEFINPTLDPALRMSLEDRYRGKIVALYVGSAQPYQGLDLLNNAMTTVKAANPNIVAVLIISCDEKNRESVNAFDACEVYSDELASSLPTWLDRADILVHSRPDVIDNINVQSKLGLYLAAGKPIVATNVGDYVSLLMGVPGCYLTVPHPHAIAEALLRAARILSDLALLSRIQISHQELAHQHFDVEINVQRLVSFYREVA